MQPITFIIIVEKKVEKVEKQTNKHMLFSYLYKQKRIKSTDKNSSSGN